MAKQFTHDYVFVFIFPANDLVDDDYEFGKKALSHRYRPYFVGEYPDYELVYFQDKIEKSTWSDSFENTSFPRVISFIAEFMGEYTYTWNVYRFVKQKILERRVFDDDSTKEGIQSDEEAQNRFRWPYSFYYTKKQFDVMKYALEKLVEEAGDRDVFVFTIPTLTEIEEYHKVGVSPLSVDLKSFSHSIENVTYIDLLPLMHDYQNEWDEYYLECDGHWSEYGNYVAYKILRENLPIYENGVSETTL
ncbi:hypothetical protein IH879_11730 [candidate division KSB1 bacterium]|nr:hypothetical protein [candidate division KSB1 bacterium]